MDWTNVLQLTCKLACACICLHTYYHHPSLPPTQQSPQMHRLNIVDIDKPLAKAAPMVKAAHDLNEDFLFSMFQFKASYIYTYIHRCRDQPFRALN